MEMKKKMRLWKASVLSVVTCLVAAGIGLTAHRVVAKGEAETYTDESVMDIAEFFNTTELMKEDGKRYGGDEELLRVDWAGNLLSRPCGITFTTRFENNSWNEDAQSFAVALGASRIVSTLTEQGSLNVTAYNTLTGAEPLATQSVENFDATQEHGWKIARVYTAAEGDSAYALRVYLDGAEVLQTEDEHEVCASSAHSITIKNSTGADVYVKSAKAPVTFEKEQNVVDIIEFSGNADLLSARGWQVASSSAALGGEWKNHPLESRSANMEWIAGFTQRSNGLAWKMKANSSWAQLNADLFRLDIGATDIRIGFDPATQEIFTYTHTRWSSELEHVATIATKTSLGKGYDPMQWHKWKVVRVKATNAAGYAVRFYIDDTLRAEIYTSGELIDKYQDANGSYTYGKQYHAVRFVNHSGDFVSFKSALCSRPVVEQEVYSDIMSYGADTALLRDTGKKISSGKSAVDFQSGRTTTYGTEWYTKTGGITFRMKADADWGSGYDKIKILLGATQIRFNAKGNHKISVHVYNNAHDYATWGQESSYLIDFDETQWHTITLTKRKFITTNGTYGEKGMQVALYIDGVCVLEKVEPTSGMWAFAARRLAVTNLSGVDVSFKSTMSETEFNSRFDFEADNISDLYDMPQQNQTTYYEEAFEGLDVSPAKRIVNSISMEEYSSTTNGVQFKLISEDAWKTSGTERALQVLSAAEAATLTTQNGKEVFRENGTGDWTDVAVTGTSGQKYKFIYSNWTSDWSILAQGDGARLKGETDWAAWSFPKFWKDYRGNLHYTEDTSALDWDSDWLASKYHLHIDFGTVTLNFKLTPEHKLVVRVVSRYTWVVMFEDYVRDEYGTPIEFKTGAYTGESAEEYFGQTLHRGDLYENTFKLSKVAEKNGNGFILRVWVNDVLALEAYDSHPLGGEKQFSYLLIDNLTGTMLNASSLASMADFKERSKSLFDKYREEDYSERNWEKVSATVQSANERISAMNSIKEIQLYVQNAMAQLDIIWTAATEAEFAERKQDCLDELNGFLQNNYGETELQQANALIASATAAINGIDETAGFGKLQIVYRDYYERLQALLTSEQKSVIEEARAEAKNLLNVYVADRTESDYSSENFAKFAAIKEKYESKIDVCTEIDGIEALLYSAYTEADAVETTADANLKAIKTAAKNSLASYKNQNDYLQIEWNVIQSILVECNRAIDNAYDEAAIEAIVQQAKNRLDNVQWKK